MFGGFVYLVYSVARWPAASVSEVAPGWLWWVVYAVALASGVLAIVVLVRRDWIARGLLVLYVLAMPFFAWGAGFYAACMYGDCI